MGNRISQDTWNKKYTLYEFLSMQEGGDLSLVDWFKKSMTETLLVYEGKHAGDCTNECCSCGLCVVENQLSDYYDYFFDKETDYDWEDPAKK